MEKETFYLTLVLAILTIIIIPLIILSVKSLISHELLKQEVKELKEDTKEFKTVIDDIHEMKSNVKLILNSLKLG